MRRFLVGFLLGVLLSHVPGVRAAQDHPDHDLSVKEIIEILSEFDVRHMDLPTFAQPAYGVTTFDTTPPAIYIFNVADMRSKKSTLFHELTHVHCRNIGVECTEEFVRAEEDRQFQKFFGVAP